MEIHETPDIHPWMCSKIDQQSNSVSRYPQIVDNLRSMTTIQFLNGLQFNNDRSITDKVGNIETAVTASVDNMQFLLCLERNSTMSELGFKSTLVDLLEETRP